MRRIIATAALTAAAIVGFAGPASAAVNVAAKPVPASTVVTKSVTVKKVAVEYNADTKVSTALVTVTLPSYCYTNPAAAIKVSGTVGVVTATAKVDTNKMCASAVRTVTVKTKLPAKVTKLVDSKGKVLDVKVSAFAS
jgi:hypothetical protein